MSKPLIISGAIVTSGGKMDLGPCSACVVSAVSVVHGGALKTSKGNLLYDINVNGFMAINGGYVTRLNIPTGLVEARDDASLHIVNVFAQFLATGKTHVVSATVNFGGRAEITGSASLTDTVVCSGGVLAAGEQTSMTRLTVSSGAEVDVYDNTQLYSVCVMSGGVLRCHDKSKVDELYLESGGKFSCLDNSEVIYATHSPQKILWDKGEQLVPPVSSAVQSNVVTLKLPKSALQAGTMTVRLEVEDA